MEWLHKLKYWILNFIYPKKKYHKIPKLIGRWDGAHCAVLRIERNTQGGMSTYRITSRYGGCDYLITLDNLSELKAELLGEFDGAMIKILGDSLPLTHRFSVWRIFINGNASVIGIWDVDLQGYTSNLNLQHLAPIRAVAGVALKPLSLIHSKRNSDLSWHNQMEKIDWLALLEKRIRGELSNPSHNIKATIVYEQNDI